MTPIDPFEQEVRAMLRRRANDIEGAGAHPEHSLMPADLASRGPRAAVFAGLVVAAALIVGLAFLWPRNVVEPDVLVAGSADATTVTSDGSVASRSVPVQLLPLIIVPWQLSIPSANEFPEGFNIAAAPVLFSATPSDGGFQSLNNFVAEYLSSRLGVLVIDPSAKFAIVPVTSDSFATSFARVEVGERTALYRWTRTGGSGEETGGWVYLRKEADQWGVIAAMADGVDLSGTKIDNSMLVGEAAVAGDPEFDVYVTSDLSAGCSMLVDGLACNGEPQSPARTGSLDGIQMSDFGSGPVVWVFEIDGGEPLSVTEVAVPAPDSFSESAELEPVGWGLPIPSAELLPEGFDISTAPVVFASDQDASNVVAAYFRDRLGLQAADLAWRIPTIPEVSFESVGLGVSSASYRWSSRGRAGDAGPAAAGWIYLRRAGGGWGVIAATTDGVSLFDLRRDEQQRVAGAVALQTQRLSMFLEFVDLDGETLADFASVPMVAVPTGVRSGFVGGPILPVDRVMSAPEVVARVIVFDPALTQSEPGLVGVSEAALPRSGSLESLLSRDAVVFVDADSVEGMDAAVEISDSLDMTVRWRLLDVASSQALYEQGLRAQSFTPAPDSGGYFAILVELAEDASVEQLRWEVDWPAGVQGIDLSSISARSSWSLRDP